MLRVFLVVLSLLLAVPRISTGATFTVNTTLDAVDANPGDGVCETAPGNGVCSLRAAILEANALPGADVITLPSGIYILTVPDTVTLDEDAGIAGDLDVNDDLTINGAGAATTAIDASGLNPPQSNPARVLDLHAGSITITDITIRNGRSSIVNQNGAGIRAAAAASVTVNRSVVSGNSGAYRGAGIYADGPLVVTDSTIVQNDFGGGIAAFGPLTVSRSTVSYNTATNFNGAGGIFAGGVGSAITDSTITRNAGELDGLAGGIGGADFTVIRSVIQANTGCAAGGVSGADFTIEDSTVDGNTTIALDYGGNRCGPGAGGVQGSGFIIRRSTISRNSEVTGGEGGGGIGASDAIIENSTVTSNVTGGFGGGVLGTATLINATVFGNRADGHGYASADNPQPAGGGLSGTFTIRNTIVAGNTSVDSAYDCLGTVNAEGRNVIGDTSGCNATGQYLVEDPMLNPLADNGGFTETHALASGSPAIGAGDPAGCLDALGQPLTSDQRGALRPSPIGTACDLGAYETGCGNGFPDLGEQCDDGAGNGTDGCCSSTCGVVDLDEDGVCNRDDSIDATITVTKAKVRRSTFAPKPNGGIAVNGSFLTSPPADTFSAASGISVRVQDGGTLNSVFTWAPSDCSTNPSGLIKCQSADHTNRGAFKPIQKAPGQWGFACSFRGLGILGPLSGPVTVDVMHGLAVDRVGTISLCTSSSAKLTCRIP